MKNQVKHYLNEFNKLEHKKKFLVIAAVFFTLGLMADFFIFFGFALGLYVVLLYRKERRKK